MRRLNFDSKQQDIWFTADPHFSHPNISGAKVSRWKSGYRIFDSPQQMDEVILHNINEKVAQDDILFIIGDFAFTGERGEAANKIRNLRNRIICKNIYFIFGNHDKELDKDRELQKIFTRVFDYGCEIRVDDTEITLCHYSHQVWNKSHYGALHLFGHSHGSLKPIGRSMDVCLENNNYFPHNFHDIKRELEKIPIPVLDHHEKRD